MIENLEWFPVLTSLTEVIIAAKETWWRCYNIAEDIGGVRLYMLRISGDPKQKQCSEAKRYTIEEGNCTNSGSKANHGVSLGAPLVLAGTLSADRFHGLESQTKDVALICHNSQQYKHNKIWQKYKVWYKILIKSPQQIIQNTLVSCNKTTHPIF